MTTTGQHSVAPQSAQATGDVDIWGWFALLAGALFWAGSTQPLGDPDVWWHVRTGNLIIESGIPNSEPWAFTALGRPWVPTAWLTDVVFALTHDAFGWRGIMLLKVLLSGLVLLALACQLFKIAPARVAAPVFALCGITLSPFLAERPQVISLLLAVWLVSVVRRAMDGDGVPWWTIAVGYAWANLHGMWILLPVALGIVSVGLVIDQRPGWRRLALRSAAIAAATGVAAMLTPVGPRLAYWPFVVQDVASQITEWRPTVLWDAYGLAYAAVFLVWGAAVARGTAKVPRSEVLWMTCLFLFSLKAGRNVAPAVILIAPFACRALARTYGVGLASLETSRLPRGVFVVSAATALSATLSLAFLRPALVEGLPLRIVAELTQRPGPVKVLNSYNVGGALTGFGAPHVSVAIDGRTDNYEPKFVDRYLAATTGLVKWRQLTRELDPDVAVLRKADPLALELRDEGWRRVLIDGEFVLLEPPVAAKGAP